MTIYEEASKLQPSDAYIELVDFDATPLGGQVYYFTNLPTGSGNTIKWRGNNYYPLPFEITGIESKGDGTAPNRPQIVISNVHKVLYAAVLSLGNLIGMRVTRWRTFFKYTDNGSEPNPIMHYPEDLWIVTKKMSHTRDVLQYELSSVLDRPGLMLPRAQILKDFGFPGVSRVRRR